MCHCLITCQYEVTVENNQRNSASSMHDDKHTNHVRIWLTNYQKILVWSWQWVLLTASSKSLHRDEPLPHAVAWKNVISLWGYLLLCLPFVCYGSLIRRCVIYSGNLRATCTYCQFSHVYPTLLLPITSPNVDRISKFFHHRTQQ